MKGMIKLLPAFIAGVLVLSSSASADEYSFVVENATKTTIKKLLVSEDGREWGRFDIGAGIKARKSETLVWDASTDGEACEQYVKAVFSDGSESEPATFDFCEKDLEIVFE